MKRQRGRGRKPGGGGGGNHGNRPLESNGPDVKIRGTSAQIYEKYAQYARDAQSGGDRVKYENYLQHAEHYFRVMVATMPRDRIYQPQEGGMAPLQGGEERAPGMPGEDSQLHSTDPLKGMDDQGGDDGDEFDGDDGDDGQGDEVEAGAGGQDDRQEGGQPGQGRGRRRRGRRRHHDGPHGDRQNVNNAGASGGNSGNSGNGGTSGGDPEARSALDSLARKQGALAGG